MGWNQHRRTCGPLLYHSEWHFLMSRRYADEILRPHVIPYAGAIGDSFVFQDDNARPHRARLVKKMLEAEKRAATDTAGSDVVQSGRPIFDDFFQHLWPYIGNNTANVVFQMVKRVWLIRIDQ
ncbi:hypothetical protein TNCV_1646891 [Trichonephila clavipes]|nr:hypothetical protein TNCV_1646891 [Trichonephila clavipes]